MAAAKTRCSQCVNSKCPVNQKPCNTCSEIQANWVATENNFLDASKNLMKED
jgi:hypothetical protein